jgi:hypothetical protein
MYPEKTLSELQPCFALSNFYRGVLISLLFPWLRHSAQAIEKEGARCQGFTSQSDILPAMHVRFCRTDAASATYCRPDSASVINSIQ